MHGINIEIVWGLFDTLNKEHSILVFKEAYKSKQVQLGKFGLVTG